MPLLLYFIGKDASCSVLLLCIEQLCFSADNISIA